MKISEDKKNKISEQILSILFDKSPQALFTSQIAKEVARDEEFTKILLHNLDKKGLVVKIAKNSQGINYSRRQRWRLSSEVHDFYKNYQFNSSINNINSLDNLE